MTTRRNFIQNTAIASAVTLATPSFGFSIFNKKAKPVEAQLKKPVVSAQNFLHLNSRDKPAELPPDDKTDKA